MTDAEIGKSILSGQANTYSLELFYDDNNTPYLNLCRLENLKTKGDKTEYTIRHKHTLDMTNIYEQIADIFKAS